MHIYPYVWLYSTQMCFLMQIASKEYMGQYEDMHAMYA